MVLVISLVLIVILVLHIKIFQGYTSDVTGEQFPLRDCLDFRPRVDNASTINSGDVDRSFDGTGECFCN